MRQYQTILTQFILIYYNGGLRENFFLRFSSKSQKFRNSLPK